MAKRRKDRLAAGEMSVLQMLWECGSLTLAEAHQEFQKRGQEIAYTTMQTRLERLVEKGALRKTDEWPARYLPAITPAEVSGPVLDLLLERVSGVVPLVAHLIQDASLSREDLAEMKRLISEAEKRCAEDAAKGKRS